MAMDPKLKREWVKALRSGEYEQAQRAMCVWNGKKFAFCCLGVLADISVDGEWELSKGVRYEIRGSCSTSMPKHTLRNAVGLSEEDADVLANMNDDGKSFNQIAAHIERRKTL